jgi:hypothetical protein
VIRPFDSSSFVGPPEQKPELEPEASLACHSAKPQTKADPEPFEAEPLARPQIPPLPWADQREPEEADA